MNEAIDFKIEGNGELFDIHEKLVEALSVMDGMISMDRFHVGDELPALRRLIDGARRKAEAMMRCEGHFTELEEQSHEIKRLKADFEAERNRTEPKIRNVSDVFYVLNHCAAYLTRTIETNRIDDDFDVTAAAFDAWNASRRVFETLSKRYGWHELSVRGSAR